MYVLKTGAILREEYGIGYVGLWYEGVGVGI